MKSKRSPSASRSTGNLIIDTSALITWVKKGQAEKLVEYSGAKISVVTLFEFLRGVKSEKGFKRAVKDLTTLFKVVPIDESTSILASELYLKLERSGTPHRDDGDLLIAATAIKKGYYLLTYDKGFSKFTKFGLKLYKESKK